LGAIKPPVLGHQPTKGQLLATNTTNGAELHRPSSAVPLNRAQNFSASFPKPGIYRTTPYACIVVAPEKGIDPLVAIRPPELAAPAPMPMLKPELHFIPLSTK